MNQHHLLSLYVSVLVPILSEWISDEDLCYLDTAVCCHKLRNSFLRILVQCNIFNAYELKDSIANMFKNWLLLRGLGVLKYEVGWDVDPKEKLLVKSKRFLHVEGNNCHRLATFFDRNQITASRVKLNYWNNDSLAVIGPRITDIVLHRDSSYVASCCSNLRSITAPYWPTVLSVIQHCPLLETIYDCYPMGLLHDWYKPSYSCDMRRTSVIDESAVGLGVGSALKYFNLTGLYDIDLNAVGCNNLAPFLKHVTRLGMTHEQRHLQVVAAAQCYNLTYLSFSIVRRCQNDILTLLTNSKDLRQIRIEAKISKGSELRSADPYLEVIALHCLRLEEYQSNHQVTIKSPGKLRFLFERCLLLRSFTYCFDEVCLVSRNGFHSDRSSARLSLSSAVHRDIVITLLKCCSKIFSVELRNYCTDNEAFYNGVLFYLPQLTRTTIHITEIPPSRDNYFLGLCSLTNLTHLCIHGCSSLPTTKMLHSKTKLKYLSQTLLDWM